METSRRRGNLIFDVFLLGEWALSLDGKDVEQVCGL
jgi:hypothetical protein